MTFLQSFLTLHYERTQSATDWSLQPKAFPDQGSPSFGLCCLKKLQSNGRPISGQDKLLDSSLHQNLNSLFHIMLFDLLNIVKLSVVCTVAVILGDKTFVQCELLFSCVYDS